MMPQKPPSYGLHFFAASSSRTAARRVTSAGQRYGFSRPLIRAFGTARCARLRALRTPLSGYSSVARQLRLSSRDGGFPPSQARPP